MYKVLISASTGKFVARFEFEADISAMVDMVASGCQVTQGWHMEIIDEDKGTQVACSSPVARGVREVYASMMNTLASMPIPPKAPRATLFGSEGKDVTVPVSFAMWNGTLTDAEDWVRGVMNPVLGQESELTTHPSPERPHFAFNGDPVTLGSAKWD